MRKGGRVSQAPPAPGGDPRNSSNPPRRPDAKGPGGLLNKLFKR
jgi:hypothetical protein